MKLHSVYCPYLKIFHSVFSSNFPSIIVNECMLKPCTDLKVLGFLFCPHHYLLYWPLMLFIVQAAVSVLYICVKRLNTNTGSFDVILDTPSYISTDSWTNALIKHVLWRYWDLDFIGYFLMLVFIVTSTCFLVNLVHMHASVLSLPPLLCPT